MRVSVSAYHAYASGKTYVLSPRKAALAAQVKEIFYRHRRYAYSTTQLSPVVDSLDHVNVEIKSGKLPPKVPIYKKLQIIGICITEGGNKSVGINTPALQ